MRKTSVIKPATGDRPIKTLDRIISKAGRGSRSEARQWILAGRVTVNGEVVLDADQWIDLERDAVGFDGEPLVREERIYLALHKPAGYLTTYNHPTGRPTVFDLLPPDHPYVFAVGRLDIDTTGLLLLTNDSVFAEKIMNPEYKVPKTYRATVSTDLAEHQLRRLRDGVPLDDGPTRPAEVTRPDANDLRTIDVTITEGRNRQVRRMIEAVGSSVEQLARIASGRLPLGDLPEGKTRPLSADEVLDLLNLE